MKQFIHKPKHLKTHRILPGHANGSRFTHTIRLLDVDRDERKARRSVWTDHQAKRRFQYGLGGSVGLIGAALALVIMLFAAMGPRANVLDTSAAPTAETVRLVDATTTSPAKAAPLKG